MAKRVTTKKPAEKRAITWDQAAAVGLLAPPVSSGVVVNEQTALGLSSLWCGIRTISQDVGTLPPVLYQETSSGTRTPAKSHPLFRLLRDEPNAYQTRPVFLETFMSHALLYGNAFAEVERANDGTPLALHLIHASNVTVEHDQGGPVYRVTAEAGSVPIPAADVLHLPGLSSDGSVGYKLLAVAREVIGFGLATQTYGASYFGNGARPGGVLKTAGQLSDTARENLRKSWAQLHQGPQKANRLAILEEGLDFSPIVSTNEQSQYVEVLSYFVYEVARLLNIPPSKLHDLQKATWGNLTELNRDYLQTTLRPWLVKLEAEIERKLLRPDERSGLYVEFDTSKLLRADTMTRYQAYAVGIGAGFLTADECRAEENLPPLPKPEPVVVQPAADVQPVNDQPTEEVTNGTPVNAV